VLRLRASDPLPNKYARALAAKHEAEVAASRAVAELERASAARERHDVKAHEQSQQKQLEQGGNWGCGGVEAASRGSASGRSGSGSGCADSTVPPTPAAIVVSPAAAPKQGGDGGGGGGGTVALQLADMLPGGDAAGTGAWGARLAAPRVWVRVRLRVQVRARARRWVRLWVWVWVWVRGRW
jgi:hypothetical protein